MPGNRSHSTDWTGSREACRLGSEPASSSGQPVPCPPARPGHRGPVCPPAVAGDPGPVHPDCRRRQAPAVGIAPRALGNHLGGLACPPPAGTRHERSCPPGRALSAHACRTGHAHPGQCPGTRRQPRWPVHHHRARATGHDGTCQRSGRSGRVCPAGKLRGCPRQQPGHRPRQRFPQHLENRAGAYPGAGHCPGSQYGRNAASRGQCRHPRSHAAASRSADLARNIGSLSLVLRNQDDPLPSHTPGVTRIMLLDGLQSAPWHAAGTELIRGTERSRAPW